MHLDVRECDRSQGAVRLKFPDLQLGEKNAIDFRQSRRHHG